ncbi:hypothetical protein [Teredinibacter turnerae]|uniref:hypothetical protein n=1 Tax=Teredinibacter turnerae TaxID=2426 RepID=UPI0030CEE0CF
MAYKDPLKVKAVVVGYRLNAYEAAALDVLCSELGYDQRAPVLRKILERATADDQALYVRYCALVAEIEARHAKNKTTTKNNKNNKNAA